MMSTLASEGHDPLELSQMPVIDTHCHAVTPMDEPLTVADFERWISLTFMDHNQFSLARRRLVREWPTDSLPRPTMMLNYLYRRMAEFLDVPLTPEQIIAARNERARDFPGYVQALMRDACIERLVVDVGYPASKAAASAFAEAVQLPIWEVLRVDRVMTDLAETTDDFDRFTAGLSARLDKGLRDPRCVGLKSVIAYLTGLNIGPEDAAAAEEEFAAFRQDPEERDFKALRDYCLHLALKLCMEHDKPMQIHCGFGDDDLYFSLSAPRHLYELLAFPPYSDCMVVLVHGGYPWEKEAAIMTNLLPNVFLDFSETCPFASYGVADMLWNVLQMAPINKVMYGSDGFHLPEVHWIGAKLGKSAASRVLARLVTEGYVGKAEALQIARRIFYDNAVELYNP